MIFLVSYFVAEVFCVSKNTLQSKRYYQHRKEKEISDREQRYIRNGSKIIQEDGALGCPLEFHFWVFALLRFFFFLLKATYWRE